MTLPRTLPATAALVALLLASLPLVGATSPWAEEEEVRVRLVTPYEVMPREGEVWMGVEFRLAPGWHVYWRNAGSAGYPPEVTSESEGLEGLELLFPAPHRYQLPGGLEALGYEPSVVYPLRARIDVEGDEASLAVDVDFLVCAATCIPYRHLLEIAQPLADSPVDQPLARRLLDHWIGLLPKPAGETGVVLVGGYHPESGSLHLDLEGLAELPRAADLFFDPHEIFRIGTPTRGPGSSFDVPLERLDVSAPLPPSTTFRWVLTGLPGGAVEGELETPLDSAESGSPSAESLHPEPGDRP